MMTATMTVTTTTDGLFLDPSTEHIVADFAIGGGAAWVLFRGTVGCLSQVTNISFN
jgi:hypothetical protein